LRVAFVTFRTILVGITVAIVVNFVLTYLFIQHLGRITVLPDTQSADLLPLMAPQKTLLGLAVGTFRAHADELHAHLRAVFGSIGATLLIIFALGGGVAGAVAQTPIILGAIFVAHTVRATKTDQTVLVPSTVIVQNTGHR